MDNQTGTVDSEQDSAGRRLEAYVRARWTRQQGGIQGLAAAIGSSTETVYSWFRGDAEPSMAHLRALAEKLGTTRAQLVAVIDDESAEPVLNAVEVETRLRSLEAAVALLGLEAGEGLRARSAPLESTGSGR